MQCLDESYNYESSIKPDINITYYIVLCTTRLDAHYKLLPACDLYEDCSSDLYFIVKECSSNTNSLLAPRNEAKSIMLWKRAVDVG